MTQRVQSTYIVECRVSILGITICDLGKYAQEQYPGTLWVTLSRAAGSRGEGAGQSGGLIRRP